MFGNPTRPRLPLCTARAVRLFGKQKARERCDGTFTGLLATFALILTPGQTIVCILPHKGKKGTHHVLNSETFPAPPEPANIGRAVPRFAVEFAPLVTQTPSVYPLLTFSQARGWLAVILPEHEAVAALEYLQGQKPGYTIGFPVSATRGRYVRITRQENKSRIERYPYIPRTARGAKGANHV